MFVKDSYSDFAVDEAMNRSLEWTSAIRQVKDPAKMSRIGSQEYWNTNVVPLLSQPNDVVKPRLTLTDLNPFWDRDNYEWDTRGINLEKKIANDTQRLNKKDLLTILKMSLINLHHFLNIIHLALSEMIKLLMALLMGLKEKVALLILVL